jgi:predicted nucleic acid-binding protein
MRDRAFLDTNILVYAFHDAGTKTRVAEELLAEGGVVGVQSLNEFVNVGLRKLKAPWETVDKWLGVISDLCPPPVAVTIGVHTRALGIARIHGYGIYDSLIVAAALEAGCRVLYSEDLQHGQKVDGLVIRNPFSRAALPEPSQ